MAAPNHAQIKAILEGVIPEVESAIDAATKPLLERIAQLESRQLERGEPGRDGKDGAAGLDGKDGAPGRDGVDGKDGAPGLDGKDGVAGRDGVDGQPGKDGRDGKDADPEIIKAQVAEAVSAAMVGVMNGLPVEFMINEAGELCATYPGGQVRSFGRARGEAGAAGASVMDGKVDDDGQLILRISDGRVLQLGSVRGEAGKPGDRGDAGKPGRDAHELQILPAIDTAKSYAEGVVAAHAGGLIRADRQTDAVVDGDVLKAGWRVILEGIADVSERVLDDGRIIERVTTFTGGRVATHQLETGAVLDRGVWREGEYQKGDGVTWAGSFFIAQRKTRGKPEVSQDWRLAVKRGRDGKNGDPGKPGIPGPPGPKGERGNAAYS